MKDVNVLSSENVRFKKSDVMSAALYHLCFLLIGFVLCRAYVFEKYMPFGISFLAGVSPIFLPSAATGVFIGYFIPGISVSGFRYIAAALAVIAVRFIISFNKKLSTNPLFAAAISAVSLSITSAVALGGIDNDILHLSLEVLVCAAAAIVVSRTSAITPNIYKGLNFEELGCLLLVISMIIAGLYGISFLGVSLSAVLAVLLILTASKYGGMQASTASSISVALLLFFAGRPAQICLIYTVAALVSGLVTSFGKYIQLCTFFTCSVVFLLTLNADAETVAFITEVLLGCMLFAFLPKNTGIRLSKIFTCMPQISVNNDLNQAITIRLSEAAAGIKDVKATVDEVAARLEGINTPGFSTVLSEIETSSCLGCKNRSCCWQTKREGTLDNIFKMIKQIKSGVTVTPSNMPVGLKDKCLRRDRFCESVNHSFLSYSSFTEANGRIQQIRQAVGEQFDGIASMLTELSRDFSNDIRFDNAAAVTAVCALKNLGIIADECSAPVDKYGRMKINLKLMKPNDAVLNKRDIMKALSLSCERNFSPPVIKKSSGETFISISEKARLKVDIGVCQKSADEKEMCGDSYSYFSDGTGHFIIILSDGMGTGSRAAVDSAMASGLMNKLIKSGFGFDCALKILNSSMLFKSTDESLATMDIASIDLFDGNAELYKAGAAPTIVRRSGHTGKAVSTSMPIGILSDVAFDKARIRLSSGDILVLLSDGATTDGTDWIRTEIESFNAPCAQDLADRLADMAKNRRSDAHTDDITVIAAMLS